VQEKDVGARKNCTWETGEESLKISHGQFPLVGSSFAKNYLTGPYPKFLPFDLAGYTSALNTQ